MTTWACSVIISPTSMTPGELQITDCPALQWAHLKITSLQRSVEFGRAGFESPAHN